MLDRKMHCDSTLDRDERIEEREAQLEGQANASGRRSEGGKGSRGREDRDPEYIGRNTSTPPSRDEGRLECV